VLWGCRVPACPVRMTRLSTSLLAIAALVSCCTAEVVDVQPPTNDAPTTFLKDCPRWVVDTTQAVWSPDQPAEAVNRSLHEYFYEGWTSISNFGRRLVGMKALEELVWSTKRAFPDLRIHVTDAFCVGNDVDGYKTVMPDILSGTNTGPSFVGPATDRRATWAGIAVCYVNRVGGRWKYVAEWVVHDELAMFAQLGLMNVNGVALNDKPDSLAAMLNSAADQPSWGWTPREAEGFTNSTPFLVNNATGLLASEATVPSNETLPHGLPTPEGKAIVQRMDLILSQHLHCYDWESWETVMEPFFQRDFVYDTIKGLDPGHFIGLHDWFYGEHVPWNNAFAPVHFTQCIFVGEEASGSTTTYATAHWRQVLGSTRVPPTNSTVRVRISDYYILKEGRININWMMLDIADLLRQADRRVLPRAHLPDDGWYQPPRAMEGVPAPVSAFTPVHLREKTRAVVLRLLQAEWRYTPTGEYARMLAEVSDSAVTGALSAVGRVQLPDMRSLWADGMRFYGPSGVGFAQSYDEYTTHVLLPLHVAFSDAAFDLDVLSCEGNFCGAHGHLRGVHSGCFAGQPATMRRVSVRVGLHWHVVNGQVQDGYWMTDMPALFEQFGVDLFERALSGAALPPQCAPLELPGQGLRDTPAAPKPLAPWHLFIVLLMLVAVASFAGGFAVARFGSGTRRSSALQKFEPPLLEKV